MRVILCLGIVAVVGGVASAERPPEDKEKAANVVVGTIEKIEAKESKFGGDGVRTDYTATIKVKKVERGKNIKEGDTIKIAWFHVTQSPSTPLPGAYGHEFKVAAKDSIRAYLHGESGTFTVIYNSAGIEKIKE